ncbi:MAG: RidA family protein [Microbacteriaceae bacterium]|jgi:enamine deaminase RidA (YjgF/YER057c/UK114 family)
MTQRQLISSGSPYEAVAGYSRAVKAGGFVFVSGTTSGGIGEDAAAQAREILDRIGKALAEAGATFADTVRTRAYLTSIADFEAVAAVHGEVFSEIRPAFAVVEVGALAGGALVEIELDALIAD